MPMNSNSSKTKRWITLAIIGSASFGLIYLWLTLEFASFANVSGLNISLGNRHELLVENIGTPTAKEFVVNENGFEFYMYHYQGVSFLVSNDRVNRITITGERHRLGGRSRIGAGSTRVQVEADLARRRRANAITRDCGCSTLRSGVTPSGAIWFSVHGQQVEIEFDYNDIVTQMSIDWLG